MAKYEAKTTETKSSVKDFIATVPDEQKQKDSLELVKIFKKQTGFDAKMWGPAIIGFGSYHYKYDSGHEGDAPLVGFSPRKNAISLYLANFDKRESMLKKFGKHKTAKSCIYLNKLSDIDVEVLKEMITLAVQYMQKKYK